MKKLQKLAYMAIGAVFALVISVMMPVIAASVQKQIIANYSNIKIYVDGALITPKDANGNIVEPFISDGTTYLPVRAVGEALGKKVEWDGKSQSVYLTTPILPGDPANILSVTPSEDAEVYRNYWNKVTPFKIDEVEYKQNNIYAVKIKSGSWTWTYIGGNLGKNYASFNLVMKIDNASLDYNSMRFQTAADDFSKTYQNNNKIYVEVYGYSPALGVKTLYSRDNIGRADGIYEHTVDIKGFEEIYIRYCSFKSSDMFGHIYCDEDYLLLFEPRMFK